MPTAATEPRNIGETVAELEEREVKRVARIVRPFLREVIDEVKAIFDSKRFALYVQAEWTPAMALKVRSRVRESAGWRAATQRYHWWLTLLRKELRNALQAGAVETVDAVVETMEELPGVYCEWDLPGRELVLVGRQPIGGYTIEEHARRLWDSLFRKLEASLRTACRRQGSLHAVRVQFNRDADRAMETLLQDLEVLVGDAVTEGQRYAMGLFVAPRIAVEA